ncbi:MAG: hypothetical protein OXG60_07750 [Chloroflexi bacterium]|nr:hypothetical protein [Chloroflexota bacterium]
MAATTDIRFKRMQGQYQTLQDAQDELFDKVDSFEAALLGLTESVAANRELIMANHEWTQRQFTDLHEKMDRLMTHLDVPSKPPAGFVKE